MNPKIIITVTSDGATEVRTEGFAGSQCIKASQFIERALGTKGTEQLTQDYFKAATYAQSQNLTQGETRE